MPIDGTCGQPSALTLPVHCPWQAKHRVSIVHARSHSKSTFPATSSGRTQPQRSAVARNACDWDRHSDFSPVRVSRVSRPSHVRNAHQHRNHKGICCKHLEATCICSTAAPLALSVHRAAVGFPTPAPPQFHGAGQQRARRIRAAAPLRNGCVDNHLAMASPSARTCR